jgi:hypothetical protein
MDNSRRARLGVGPLPWLLAPTPRRCGAATTVDPIWLILAAQDPAGWWATPPSVVIHCRNGNRLWA